MKAEQFGHVFMSSGTHSVQVKTGNQPSRVYLSIESEGDQVCGESSYSCANAYVIEDGFVIRAQISSNAALIHWRSIG